MSRHDRSVVKPLLDRLEMELTAHRTLALRDAVANNPHVAITALLHKLVVIDTVDRKRIRWWASRSGAVAREGSSPWRALEPQEDSSDRHRLPNRPRYSSALPRRIARYPRRHLGHRMGRRRNGLLRGAGQRCQRQTDCRGAVWVDQDRRREEVTMPDRDAELLERTVGCRRVQECAHSSRTSRSAESPLPTRSWRRLLRSRHPIPSSR